MAFILSLFTSCSQQSDAYLVKNGATRYRIVLSDSPQPVALTAAKELKAYLDAMTGIDWAVAPEKDVPEDVPQILVGNSSRAKKFFPELDPEQIPYDGIEIHLKNDKLLLTGHAQRGALYAVNTFLEDVCGVRWWTSTEETVPFHKTFKLKPLNISYAPKLIFRESYYQDAFNPLFATRMKCNGVAPNITPEYGDHQRFAYFVHTFFLLIPPEKYFKDHPEWFSENNGVRNYHRAQLCLTNDEMRKELTKNAIETLRSNPQAKFISISQEDWAGYCTCDKCTQVAEEEGSQAGPVIRFVNQVAEAIEKEFPDVFVETLAYQYTRKPPKHVKPRRNVVIRLCTIECSFVQPLTGEQNQSLCEDMEGWSKIAHQLFVWDYVTNFKSYILPHPNLRVLAPNIRFFVDHGTIGLFEQGDAHSTVGDFVRMRNWVISHLMWDPTRDGDQLTREFLTGYYGEKAAPVLLEYFDALIDRAEATGNRIGCFVDTEDSFDWLDYETLCRATARYDKAIDAARQEGDVFVGRLRRERLPLEHLWLEGYHKLKRMAQREGVDFCGPADPLQACRDFFAVCEQYKVTHDRENAWPFDKFRDNMLRRFGETPADAPDEYKNLDPDKRMDIQEYDFRLRWPAQSAMVDDPAASNGRAMKLTGDRDQRDMALRVNIDHPLFDRANADAKFKVIVYARCEATAKDGKALVCYVYDYAGGGDFGRKEISVPEMAGPTYKKIEFEPFSSPQSLHIRFESPKRDGAVQAIYIDRVFIVRDQ